MEFDKYVQSISLSKLVESLSKEQVDFENGDEVPISFAEFDAKDTEESSSRTVKTSDTTCLESTSLSNNSEAAVNDEVDPIAIDIEDTPHLGNKTIKVEDCTNADGSDTNFLYISTRAEMDYVSIVDHIDPPSVEKIMEVNKTKAEKEAKEAAKRDASGFELVKNCCCLICGKTYWSIKIFTSHMRTHGFSMKTTSTVEDGSHVSSVTHRCGFCRKVFDDKKKLKSHPCPSHKPRKAQFTGHVKCSRCGQLFSVLKELNEHIAKSHMHTCSYCGKSYNQESSLVVHLETKHKREDRKGRLKGSEDKDGKEYTQKRAKITKERNEEIVPITSQQEVPVTRRLLEPVMRIRVQDLTETPLGHCERQQQLQITDDLPLQSSDMLIKKEVDLGVGTVGVTTLPNYEDGDTNYQVDRTQPQSMAVDMDETRSNAAALWQTVFPCKIEPFFDAPTRMEQEQQSEVSPPEETDKIDSAVQEEKTEKCCSCLICDSSFQHLSQFVEHMEDHDESEMNQQPRPGRVPCTVCKKSYMKLSSYQRHLVRGKCPKTPLTAVQLADRAKKAERKAEKEAAKLASAKGSGSRNKAYSDQWKRLSKNSVKCTVCSRTFTQARELEMHLREHKSSYKKDREFSCVYCDKRFHENEQLTLHIQKIHLINL